MPGRSSTLDTREHIVEYAGRGKQIFLKNSYL